MKVEFLDIVLGYLVLVIQVAVAVIAVVKYQAYKNTPLKYISIILIYTAINEIIGSLNIYSNNNNVLIYNIYNVIYFLFFYNAFWFSITKEKYRNWIVACVGIFVLASVVNPFFQNFITESQLLAYVVGACALLFCIILYYIEILSTSKVLLIRQDILFWISVGLLLFYVGYIPIKLTRVFFEYQDNVYLALRIVHRILILILNACFIIGFLWMKKKLPR
ncbi:hypothetical protein GM418_12070 [Maribellus comscasis]|uniref:Uncharacterized protein n=1 Tax=Maribellus comscasis TaxID=2681766 RepID=A0A6I6JN69_9BACT|nr:hypothetical protein [Maribellus comscasis]QGY44365.1 hypothetical protein GM418_12070 [Maribellus comscasis]